MCLFSAPWDHIPVEILKSPSEYRPHRSLCLRRDCLFHLWTLHPRGFKSHHRAWEYWHLVCSKFSWCRLQFLRDRKVDRFLTNQWALLFQDFSKWASRCLQWIGTEVRGDNYSSFWRLLFRSYAQFASWIIWAHHFDQGRCPKLLSFCPQIPRSDFYYQNRTWASIR